MPRESAFQAAPEPLVFLPVFSSSKTIWELVCTMLRGVCVSVFVWFLPTGGSRQPVFNPCRDDSSSFVIPTAQLHSPNEGIEIEWFIAC